MTGARVIVTDAQERAVLASLRSLHACGFHVTAVATAKSAPGLWSRSADRRFVIADARDSIDEFVTGLDRIVGEGRYDVMLAGTDASLFAISRHRDRLAANVCLGLPSAEAVEAAFDRGCVAQAADRAGLEPPESRVCDRVEDALEAADQFGFPVLVKPLHTVLEVDGAACRWASRVSVDADAVRSAVRLIGRCVVQRHVTGPVISVGAVAADGKLLASVVSRYVRTWPVEGGNVSFSETIAPPADLTERVQALAADLQWRGIFELELIALENGDFAAIDFNPRAYGSMALAVAAGAPLPALWCQWLLGTRADFPRARVGARYRWEDADLRHLAQCLWGGDVRGALSAAAPRRDVTHAYFRAGDPFPAVVRSFQVALLMRQRRRERRAQFGARESSAGHPNALL